MAGAPTHPVESCLALGGTIASKEPPRSPDHHHHSFDVRSREPSRFSHSPSVSNSSNSSSSSRCPTGFCLLGSGLASMARDQHGGLRIAAGPCVAFSQRPPPDQLEQIAAQPRSCTHAVGLGFGPSRSFLQPGACSRFGPALPGHACPLTPALSPSLDSWWPCCAWGRSGPEL
jgi:hypothetical protein